MKRLNRITELEKRIVGFATECESLRAKTKGLDNEYRQAEKIGKQRAQQ